MPNDGLRVIEGGLGWRLHTKQERLEHLQAADCFGHPHAVPVLTPAEQIELATLEAEFGLGHSSGAVETAARLARAYGLDVNAPQKTVA